MRWAEVFPRVFPLIVKQKNRIFYLRDNEVSSQKLQVIEILFYQFAILSGLYVLFDLTLSFA